MADASLDYIGIIPFIHSLLMFIGYCCYHGAVYCVNFIPDCISSKFSVLWTEPCKHFDVFFFLFLKQ